MSGAFARRSRTIEQAAPSRLLRDGGAARRERMRRALAGAGGYEAQAFALSPRSQPGPSHPPQGQIRAVAPPQNGSARPEVEAFLRETDAQRAPAEPPQSAVPDDVDWERLRLEVEDLRAGRSSEPECAGVEGPCAVQHAAVPEHEGPEDPCWIGSLPETGHSGPYFCWGPGHLEGALYTSIPEEGARLDVGRVNNEVGLMEGPYGGTRFGLRAEAQGVRVVSPNLRDGGGAPVRMDADLGTASAELSLGTDGGTASVAANVIGCGGTWGEFTPRSGNETQIRVAGSEGPGVGLSVRRSDVDGDGATEYGGGFGYGPIAVDVASERRR